MSTTTIILLILGVIVLVVLILGFTIGWNKIVPWISSNNVNTVVTSCDAACATGDKYGFCSAEKELNDGTSKIKSTCYYFSNKKTIYGINKCLSIDCGIYDSAELARTAVCNLDPTSTKEVTYLAETGQETMKCGQLSASK
jgi:hypothetical protein